MILKNKPILIIIIVSIVFCLTLALRDSQIIAFGMQLKPKLSEAEKAFHFDFQNYLQTQKELRVLPQAFASVQYVKYNFHAEQLSKLFGENSLPIGTRPNGTFYLELDFISMPSSPTELFIVQIGLIDINTKNKIWESSENFKIKK